MYVYIKSDTNLWTVGFYKPDGDWEPQKDFPTEREAMEVVHYLNGGNPEDMIPD